MFVSAPGGFSLPHIAAPYPVFRAVIRCHLSVTMINDLQSDISLPHLHTFFYPAPQKHSPWHDQMAESISIVNSIIIPSRPQPSQPWQPCCGGVMSCLCLKPQPPTNNLAHKKKKKHGSPPAHHPPILVSPPNGTKNRYSPSRSKSRKPTTAQASRVPKSNFSRRSAGDRSLALAAHTLPREILIPLYWRDR